MEQKIRNITAFDWLTFILFLSVSAIGIGMIYSVDFHSSTQFAFKQSAWLIISILIGFSLFFIPTRIIKNWSSLFYLIGILLLAGLFVFGEKISGSLSWYRIGGMSFQPSELVKLTTTLGLAKLLNEYNFSLKNLKDIIKTVFLIGTPLLLILLQPDVGTVITFIALLPVLYREGLKTSLLLVLFWIIATFIITIYVGFKNTALAYLSFTFIIILYIFFKIRKQKWIFIFLTLIFLVTSVLFSLFTSFVFNHLLLPHQQKRIELMIGKIKDDKGVGYHLKQSLIAISNGKWTGKGWLQGSQMRGHYVPEQHTDYIFTALAEQFGWWGSLGFLALYFLLIWRIYYLAERQKTIFSRVTGYALASFLAVHLFINLLMITGWFPTIGIPIIFVSYGGSSLLSFTLFLLLFLALDARRREEY